MLNERKHDPISSSDKVTVTKIKIKESELKIIEEQEKEDTSQSIKTLEEIRKLSDHDKNGKNDY